MTYNGLVEFGLNLSQQPVKSLGGQAELLRHAFGTECGAQVDVEEQSGVLLGLFAQRVIAIHNHQFLTELMNTCGSTNQVIRLRSMTFDVQVLTSKVRSLKIKHIVRKKNSPPYVNYIIYHYGKQIRIFYTVKPRLIGT